MSEQDALEALLRVAFPEWGGEDIADTFSDERGQNTPLEFFSLKNLGNILSHLRAEKAKAEAAALERAKEYFKPLQGTEGAFSWRGERIVSDLDKMISPAVRSALAERDAKMRDESLDRAATLFDQNAKDCAWISAAIRALKSKQEG